MATTRLVSDIAEALVERAHAAQAVEQVVEDVIATTDAAKNERKLFSSLSERALPLPARQDILQRAFKKEVHPYVVNALLILQRHNLLLKGLGAFRSAVVREAARQAGHHVAHLRSAKPMGAKDRKQVEQALKEKFKGTFHMVEEVDESLLGGFVVTVEDWRIDTSIKTKLERLKHALYV